METEKVVEVVEMTTEEMDLVGGGCPDIEGSY